MTKVRLVSLCKNYAGARGAAVENLSLEIKEGEFMALVGPSGCGKSTTLRMIAGLEEATAGDIYIGDVRVNDMHPKDRDIAMVFQNYALYPHMTVFKNMAFGLMLRKQPKSEIDRRVREASEILGLNEEMLVRKPAALSGGQRQRVALGRAMVRKPKVFLFDEPLSNLDAKMRVQMRSEISRLHRTLASTMIYVTHDQVEAMTMADRICLMKDGRILQVAPPLEIYQRPANMFVAAFIGSPPMNFFPGSVRAQDGRLFFCGDGGGAASEGVIRLEIDPIQAKTLAASTGKQVVLGLRPENIQEAEDSVVPGREFVATLEAAEPMGAETLLYLARGGLRFIARSRRESPPPLENALRLSVRMENARFFSPPGDEAPARGEGPDYEAWQARCSLIV